MKTIEGGVTAAKGFEAAATAAEIKYKGRTDMAMIYSRKPCAAAGTFTTNVVKAAPVKWDQEIVRNAPYVQAVVINSGIANACTGAEGYGYCRETASGAAEILNIPETSVLVASTGVIGMQLPIDRIKAGSAKLAEIKTDTIEAGYEAAKAIMTTDTVPKEIAVEFTLGGKTVTMGGMCKGSGMIHPNMCTMLGFITTDAAISKEFADFTITCTSPSKTFNLAGMKTSNIVIHNKELQAAWKELIGGKLSMNGAGTLGLTAMIAAYNEGEEWLEQLKEYLDGNFAYIDAFLKEHLPKAHMVPSEGTYLAWIDFNGYVDGDAEKLEEIMQKKARVALDEGYIFGDAGRGFERINIATPRSVVEDCMDRILKAFKEEKLV